MKNYVLFIVTSIFLFNWSHASSDHASSSMLKKIIADVENNCGIPSHTIRYWAFGHEAYAPCRKALKALDDIETEKLTESQKDYLKKSVNQIHLRVKNDVAGLKGENYYAIKTPLMQVNSSLSKVGIAGSLLYGYKNDDDNFLVVFPILIGALSTLIEGMGEINQNELEQVSVTLEAFVKNNKI